MLKAILFDFDGVLTIDKTGSGPVLAYIAKSIGVNYEILKQVYYSYNEDLLNGEKTHEQIWKDLCSQIGQNIDYNILSEAYKHTSLDSQMFDLVKQLKEKYLVGVITDNKFDRIDEIFEYYQLYPLFDVVTISAKERCRKSGKKIFENTLSKLNVKPEESIFIDNSPKNLIAPKEMGIHTLLFDDEIRDIEVVRKAIADIIF